MPILNITTSQTGLVSVQPSLSYINTSDPISKITSTGYLNKEVANGVIFNLPCLAIVSTKATPTSPSVSGTYNVIHTGDNWSLTAPGDNTYIPLANGHIFVGNTSNIATDVTMTGDIGINNTGVTAISAGVIVNADINAGAAIAFSKLAALPSADILVGSAGNVPTAVPVSGDGSLSNTGVFTLSNNVVTSNKTALSFLQFFSMPITAAQFLGMFATPILLVAAPGVNQLLILEQMELVMTYGTTTYAGGGTAAVQYDSTANGAGTLASTTVSAGALQSTVSADFTFVPTSATVKTFSTCVNKGLYLSNITAAFNTGNSNFVANIWYRQITTV